MSTEVQAEAVVARPREEVAAYASDWRNDPAWIRALSDVRLLTDQPFAVGAQVERVASFLGKRIEYVNEVIEWEPGRRLVMRSVKAPFPMTVVYEFEDAGEGTRMRIRTQGDASGFYKLAGPLLDRAVKKGVEGDLAQLKRNLEGAT
jgi:uncharacterized membrane protein